MNSPPLSTFLSHSIIHPLGCHTYLLSLVSLYTQFSLSTIHLAVDPGSHPLPVPPLCPSSIYLFITSLIYHLCLSSLLSNLFLTLVYSWVCVCVSECGWASQKMITNCRIICSLCVCVCAHVCTLWFIILSWSVSIMIEMTDSQIRTEDGHLFDMISALPGQLIFFVQLLRLQYRVYSIT